VTSYADNDVNQGDSTVWPDDDGGSCTVTETLDRVYFACPSRLTDSEDLTFYDPNTFGAEFAFKKHTGTVEVTNIYGYTEDYWIYVSEDTLWSDGGANDIKFFTDNV
jgi:hypothetical protein